MQLTPPQPPQDDGSKRCALVSRATTRGHAGTHLRGRIASFIKDEGARFTAASSPTSSGAGCVDWLWIDERIRPAMAGAAACSASWSSTPKTGHHQLPSGNHQFSGLLYQKQGCEVFGQLPDMPPGHVELTSRRSRISGCHSGSLGRVRISTLHNEPEKISWIKFKYLQSWRTFLCLADCIPHLP